MKHKLSSILALSLLVGCAKNIDHHGHLVEPDDVENIKVGVSTKDEVAKVLGAPSSVSTFRDNEWYYVAETRERVAFFLPQVVDSKVTVVSFDDAGKVKEISFDCEYHKENVKMVKRETPTSGHKFGFFEQMFGNVGRFGGKDPDAPSAGGIGGE